MTTTISIEELKEQLKDIRKSAEFIKDRSMEMNDDEGTQAYTRAYSSGMYKAVDILEKYINSKE